MDKFERAQQYCVNGDLAIKTEGMEDTFKDIAVYSTLAMILFRKEQDKQQDLTGQRKPSTKVFDKTQEWIELERGKGSGLSMNDLREAAEKQQETESLFTPQVPLNIDDDCLGTPKLKFNNKNVSDN